MVGTVVLLLVLLVLLVLTKVLVIVLLLFALLLSDPRLSWPAALEMQPWTLLFMSTSRVGSTPMPLLEIEQLIPRKQEGVSFQTRLDLSISMQVLRVLPVIVAGGGPYMACGAGVTCTLLGMAQCTIQ